MRNIRMEKDIILYYGNPAGYVSGDKAVVDPLFQSEELNAFLSRQKDIGEVKWTDGVYDRLVNGQRDTQELTLLKSCRVWQLKPESDLRMRFISLADFCKEFGEPQMSDYQTVYDGEVETNNLEALYTKFNIDHPPGYTAQIAYYTEKISKNKDWELAGIFADEGITGTSAKKRTEFLKLMALCEKGKVDMVLTKSVSRFSRNTLDAIGYIRKLKAKGIPIIFEKEGINTMEMASEMALCFLSGFAQAESESISRNVTWGKRQSFKSGKVSFQYSRLLGYEKSEDGQPKIVPEEAEIVKRIFRSYYSGASVRKIKESLEADKILSPTGKQEWSIGVLQYMLRNACVIISITQ